MSKLLITPIYRLNIGGSPITPEQLDCNIEITMDTAFEADTFEVEIFNIDQINQVFLVEGNLVTIELGYAGIFNSIITGIITKIFNRDNQSESIIVIEGMDRVIFQLKRTPINLTISNKRDVIDIIKDICIQSGVVLEPSTPSSGIILDNYSISDTNGFNEIRKLVKRIGYNATAKNNILFITPTISTNIVSALITDELGYRLTKTSGVSQDDVNKSKGFNFFGAGIPTLTPMKIVNVNMIEQKITGNYIIETIIHKYNSKTGYTCLGTMIEPSAIKSDSVIVQFSTAKTISSLLNDKFEAMFKKKHAIFSGEVEELFTNDRNLTAKIGINEETIKSSVVPSVEANIGDKNVFIVKKPLSSQFAGNGFGLLMPVYKNMRAIVGSNNYDIQDSNILGFLWKSTDIIPEHDKGDYMFHHINHSKHVMKESGDEIKQAKSLKIQIGNSFLTINKPTATSDGDLVIEFSNGDKLSRIGSEWIINASSIKIGSGATLGAARLTDTVLSDITSDPAFWAFMAAFYGVVTGAPIPEAGNGAPSAFQAALSIAIGLVGGTPTSQTGKINQASNKVKIE